MNKYLISTLFILSFSQATWAGQSQQNQPLSPAHKPIRIAHLVKALGLNQEEKTKVEAIINDEKLKFMALKQEERTRLQGVLTAEQMAKFDALHQKHSPDQPQPVTGESGNNN